MEVTSGNTVDRREIELILNGEGFSDIYEWSDSPNARYGWHKHPYNEVRWVINGSILIGHEGGEVTLKAGDRLNVPASAKHWAKVASTGVTYICASG